MELCDLDWKEFDIAEFFDITGSKTTSKKVLEKIGNGTYPYVTTQTTNNGQAGYFAEYTEQGNVLVVDSAVAGFCTYQENNFTASDHVEKLVPKCKFNKYIAIFLTLQINNNNFSKFSYGYKASQIRLRRSKIMLPVDKFGNPNFEYMEQYIYNLEKTKRNEYIISCKNTLKKLGEIVPICSLSETTWKPFYIDDIFNVESGKRLESYNMNKGTRPFIGAIDSGNGITNYVSNKNDSIDKNVLGVNYNGNGMAISFYHPYECIFSDDVKRFHLKEYPDNKFVLLFFKTIILQQKPKYNYGYKFNGTRMKRQIIMIPVDNAGNPDYKFMEQYIKNLMIKKYNDYLAYAEK